MNFYSSENSNGNAKLYLDSVNFDNRLSKGITDKREGELTPEE